MYTLEATLRHDEATADEIAAARTEKALPIMDAKEEWMVAVHTQCTRLILWVKPLIMLTNCSRDFAAMRSTVAITLTTMQ